MKEKRKEKINNSEVSDLTQNKPLYISLDQLTRECKIAKRSARYLIDNGIIPVIAKKGNKTWKYQIAYEDVLAYLEKRKKYGSMIPRGAVNNPSKCVRTKLSAKTEADKVLESQFRKRAMRWPEAMGVSDAALLLGLSEVSVRKHIKSGNLHAESDNWRYIIASKSLLSFVESEHYFRGKSYGDKYERLIGGFEKWIAAKL